MTLHKSFLFVAIALLSACHDVKVSSLDKNSIPKSIRYKGHIVVAAKYSDVEGEHIVIASETGNVDVKIGGETFQKADLYAYNYLVAGDNYVQKWQLHDYAMVCPVDTKAIFLPNTFAVTDLNKDGKAEVWLMYVTGCRGDPTPGAMKIIMHHGQQKFAVRGESQIHIMNTTVGGEYEFDKAFKAGPAVFRHYALTLWNKNLSENW